MVGGTASRIAGGSFESGAVIGFFSRAFNEALHERKNSQGSIIGRIWHDVVYGMKQGFHAAVGLVTNGPAPARYTLQGALVVAGAPAIVAAPELLPPQVTGEMIYDYISSALPATAPTPSMAGAAGVATAKMYEFLQWIVDKF